LTSHYVRVEVKDHIAHVTIDNPPVNTLGRAVLAEIGSIFRSLDRDPNVRAVILLGAGRAFAAGGDVPELARVSGDEASSYAHEVQRNVSAIAKCGKMVVASIHGFALGGGAEIALAADQRIASRDAMFGLPEVQLGVIPGAGATRRLAQVVGIAAASDLICSGRIISADEALEIGLVDRVVESHELAEATLERARRYADLHVSSHAVRAAKTLLRDEDGDALAAESDAFADLLQAPHARSGMAAFLSSGRLGTANFGAAEA
jgi:enoyl-CoA hydratase/carnithine racemase